MAGIYVGASYPNIAADKDALFADIEGHILYKQTRMPSGTDWVVEQRNYYLNLSSDVAGGGSPVWGKITGNINDQADLKAALDSKVGGSGTAGRVAYFTAEKTIGSGALYWDNANARLGIGTDNVPYGDAALFVNVESEEVKSVMFRNAATGIHSGISYYNGDDGDYPMTVWGMNARIDKDTWDMKRYVPNSGATAIYQDGWTVAFGYGDWGAGDYDMSWLYNFTESYFSSQRMIHSAVDGFRFPDNSVQTTAAIGVPAGGAATDYLRGGNTWAPLNTAVWGLISVVAPLAYASGLISVGTGYAIPSDAQILSWNNKEPAIAGGLVTQFWSGIKTWVTLDTSVVPENGNLYYTDARSRLAQSNSVTGLTYNNTTGVWTSTAGYGIPTTAKQASWDAKVDGTGTANYITYWTGVSNIDDTGIYYDTQSFGVAPNDRTVYRLGIGTGSPADRSSAISIAFDVDANYDARRITFMNKDGNYSEIAAKTTFGAANTLIMGYNIKTLDDGSGHGRYNTGQFASFIQLGAIGGGVNGMSWTQYSSAASTTINGQINATSNYLQYSAGATGFASFTEANVKIANGIGAVGTNVGVLIRSTNTNNIQTFSHGFDNNSRYFERIYRPQVSAGPPTVPDPVFAGNLRTTIFYPAATNAEGYRTIWGNDDPTVNAVLVLARNQFHAYDNGSSTIGVAILGQSNVKGAFFHGDGSVFFTGSAGTYTTPLAGIHGRCSVIIDPTGAKVIEVDTNAKLGFFGATPIVRQPALTASDGTLANAVARIAELEAIIKNFGLSL